MSSCWFLFFFTSVLCFMRVVNTEIVPKVLLPVSAGQGVVGDTNPRSNEDGTKITNLNAKGIEPSKSNETVTFPKHDALTEKKVSNNKIVNVKPAVSSNVVYNVSEIQNSTLDTSHHNHSDSFYTSIKSMREHLTLDNGAVKRTFYVVAGLTGIVLIYFMIKGITMRRKPRIPRYGLLSERELEAFDDGDDEDEDTTLFDAARYKKKSRGP